FTHPLLSASVVGLGASMDLAVVARAGLQGFGATLLGISMTLGFGLLLGRMLRTDEKTSTLISAGTAICGGSAIAATAPVIHAQAHQVSVALGTVFCLNAVALVIFPPIGHALHLSETQFGIWSALAIHDTSSVVGATLQYGAQALEIGTTIKLARALWIVPITLALGALFQRRLSTEKTSGPSTKPKRPWFILGFLLMAALVTWAPALRVPGQWIAQAAKRGMVLTLFLIGSNLTRDTLCAVGFRPLLQGLLLWILTASTTLLAVLTGWLS
ncbi:MAG: putative sulfate exporter family transporter, partial [Proteobacteria bacterium]|nr:putative sulfate exporter family transporter [Pseudomonadota bacterium]